MLARLVALGLGASLALAACGGGSASQTTDALGACTPIDASASCVVDAGTYDATIVPILAKSCLPGCHDNSPDAAWPLTDPDDIKAWTSYVDRDLLLCTMPPKGSRLTISDADRATIINWLTCGAP